MNLVFSSSKPIDILIQFGQPKAVSCRTITPFFNNFSVMRFASFSEFQVVVIKFAIEGFVLRSINLILY